MLYGSTTVMKVVMWVGVTSFAGSYLWNPEKSSVNGCAPLPEAASTTVAMWDLVMRHTGTLTDCVEPLGWEASGPVSTFAHVICTTGALSLVSVTMTAAAPAATALFVFCANVQQPRRTTTALPLRALSGNAVQRVRPVHESSPVPVVSTGA